MTRREFITLLGGAAATWPLAARAPQPAMPVIGGWPDSYMQALGALQKGLNGIGFVDGQNLAIEYRWAGNEYAQFPSLAADLVRRQVNVVAALGNTG